MMQKSKVTAVPRTVAFRGATPLGRGAAESFIIALQPPAPAIAVSLNSESDVQFSRLNRIYRARRTLDSTSTRIRKT